MKAEQVTDRQYQILMDTRGIAKALTDDPRVREKADGAVMAVERLFDACVDLRNEVEVEVPF